MLTMKVLALETAITGGTIAILRLHLILLCIANVQALAANAQLTRIHYRIDLFKLVIFITNIRN